MLVVSSCYGLWFHISRWIFTEINIQNGVLPNNQKSTTLSKSIESVFRQTVDWRWDLDLAMISFVGDSCHIQNDPILHNIIFWWFTGYTDFHLYTMFSLWPPSEVGDVSQVIMVMVVNHCDDGYLGWSLIIDDDLYSLQVAVGSCGRQRDRA